jgi:hypothetical protein
LDPIGQTTDGADIELCGGERYDLRALHEAWSAPLRDFYGDAA